MNNGFNCPKVRSNHLKSEAKDCLADFEFPIMVKPVVASGSRGVTRIFSLEEFDRAFDEALLNSKQKLVILEEYIDMTREFS